MESNYYYMYLQTGNVRNSDMM